MNTALMGGGGGYDVWNPYGANRQPNGYQPGQPIMPGGNPGMMRYPGGNPNGPLQAAQQPLPPQVAPRTGIQPIAAANQPPQLGQPPMQTVANTPAPPPTNPSAVTGINPQTIQNQFPNGIPQLGIPQIAQTQIAGTAMDPGQAVSAIEAYMLPQQQQQQQALAEQLNAAGIYGGTTAKANEQLAQSQQSDLLNNIQPFILANQQLGQQAQTTNAGLGQAANQYNADQLASGQEYNIQNLLQTAGTDAGTFNNFMQFLMGMQNQDWLSQLGSETNLQTAGMGAQTSAFNPIYQSPQPVNFGSLAGAFAPTPQTPLTPAQVYNNQYPGGYQFMPG